MITDKVRKVKTITVPSPNSPSQHDACIRDAEGEILMVAYDACKGLELAIGDVVTIQVTILRQREEQHGTKA